VSDGLMKTSDGTPALISSNNINQVLNVFIPHDKLNKIAYIFNRFTVIVLYAYC